MYPSGHGKQVFRFGGKGKGMYTKKWQIHQLNFTHRKQPFQTHLFHIFQPLTAVNKLRTP